MTKKILAILAVAGAGLILGLVANQGVKKMERIECQEWQRQGETIPSWYAVGWQVEQCLNYQIELK